MMVSSATGIPLPTVRSPFAGNAPAGVPGAPPQDLPQVDVASRSEGTALGTGLLIGTAALIGVMLPGAVTGPAVPVVPVALGDSIAQVLRGEVAGRFTTPEPVADVPARTGTADAPTRPVARQSTAELPVVILEDPLSHIPTVPAIPYLHADDDSAQMSIRTEALGKPGTPELAEALLDRYGANEPLIDRMLQGDPTEGQRDSIRRDLGILPTAMIRRVAEAGTRIWAVPPDVTAVPTSLFRANGRSDREIEAQWRQYNSTEWPMLGQPPTVMRVQAKAPESIPAGNSTDMLAGYPWAGQTLEDMARFQGASTPEEVAGYVRLARMMNPGLREGQPLKAGVELNVPDVYIHQGQRYSQATWNDMRFIDFELQNHRIEGLYVARQDLIVVLDETLADPSRVEGHRRIVLHEFGHAVDHVAESDPSWGAEHRSTIDRLHASARQKHASGDPAAFITDYARTNPAEHYAESFEAYFTGYRRDPVDAKHPTRFGADYEVLMARDPDMAGLIAQDAEHLQSRPVRLPGISAARPEGPTHVDARSPRINP